MGAPQEAVEPTQAALLDELYAAAAEPKCLQRFLRRFADVCHADAIEWAADRDGHTVWSFTVGEDLVTPRPAEPGARRPDDGPWSTDGPREVRGLLHASEQFQRFTMRTADRIANDDHVLHVCMVRFDELHGQLPFFVLRRRQSWGAFTDDELTNLERHVVHLRNVTRLLCAEAVSQLRAETALTSLERSSVGVFFCNREGEVTWASPTARKLVDEPGPLELAHQRLHTGHADQTTTLHRALRAAADGAHPRPQLFRATDHGGSEVQLTVCARDLADVVAPASTAVVLAIDPARRSIDPQALRELWGLTASEARVASSLAQGRSPEQIAAEGGVGMETVRSQLKAAYAKTQTKGQADLVRLVLSSMVRWFVPAAEGSGTMTSG